MIGCIFPGSRENLEVFPYFGIKFPVKCIHDILFFIAVQVNCEAVSLLLSAAEEANLKRLVRVTGKARQGLLGRFNNVKQR